jgi:putative membrane protein
MLKKLNFTFQIFFKSKNLKNFMLRIALYFLTNILAILLLSSILEGFEVGGTFSATVFIIFLTFLNFTVVPILKLLALPINLISLGLVNLIINLLVIIFLAGVLEGVAIIGTFAEQLVTTIIILATLFVTNSLVDSYTETKKDN